MLGYLWSLLRPLGLFAVLYVVFARFLRFGDAIPNYPIYLLLGIVIWTYFVEVTVSSVESIVGKGDLIRKLNFPKYIIVAASSVSAFINLLINFLIIGVFMVVSDVDIFYSRLPFIGILLLELFIFSLAISFLLSSLYVRYRDIRYIWEVLIQAAFYATPILYPLTLVPELASKFIMLNPMAQIIQDMRYILVTQQTQTISSVFASQAARLIPVSLVLVIAVASSVYFRNRSRYFAEEV